MLKYEFSSKALKQLQKLDHPIQTRLVDKLDEICGNQTLPADINRLTDSKLGEYRIRVGNYRIIFDLENDTLVILKVGHRRDIYKNK